MKNTKLTFLFAILFNVSFAQDTIFKRNEDKIIAKIIEINPTEVKYKKYDFQDGPTYIESKSAIKEIHFVSGYKEIFSQIEQPKYTSVSPSINYGLVPPSNKIDMWGSRFKYQGNFTHENQIHNMMLSTKDKRIMNLVGKAKDAKSMQYIGFAGIAFGIASYVYVLKGIGLFSSSYSSRRNSSNDFVTSGIFFAAAVACPIISGVNKAKRNQYNREAVRLYNEKF